MKLRIPLKVWVAEESRRLAMSEGASRMRLHRGRYPDLKLVRFNSRVIDVEVEK